MIAAFHSVYLYLRRPPDEALQRALDFPGEANLGDRDFMYFSFVMGMAAQTISQYWDNPRGAERKRIQLATIANRRLQHRLRAA